VPDIPTDADADAILRRAIDLAARIKPLMTGQGPDVQGAVLVELVARHLAGHAKRERSYLLALHIKSVRDMIPVVEEELFGTAGHPGNRNDS
jgi:hypothetical protein